MVDLPLTTWLAAAMAFVAVALGTVSVALLLEWSQESRRRKVALRQLQDMAARGFESGDAGLLRGHRALDVQWLVLFSTRLPHLRDIRLMLEQPSMIKRPVLDVDGKLIVGFRPEEYAETFR